MAVGVADLVGGASSDSFSDESVWVPHSLTEQEEEASTSGGGCEREQRLWSPAVGDTGTTLTSLGHPAAGGVEAVVYSVGEVFAGGHEEEMRTGV